MTSTSPAARRHLGTTLMLTGATLALLGMARTVRPSPSGPIKAGHHLIEVFNDAAQPHELVLVKLAPGKLAADVAAWEMSGGQGPFPGRPVGGIVAIAPGTSGIVEVTLEAGSYAMVCFVPDAKDGRPHLMHGMLAPLTIELSAR